MKRRLLKTQIRSANLNKLAENSIHYYSATGIDNMTYKSYISQKEKIHKQIRDDILNRKYKFVRYKEKLIIKNRYSNPRCISIPTLKDRLANKVILETLKEYYPECAQTKLPQECIRLIKDSLGKRNNNYYIKLDLSDFYGNIDHQILLKKLRNRINDKTLIDLIIGAIQTPTFPEFESPNKGVPQGLSISNILSQIYMLDFDQTIQMLNCQTIRYVDDIIVICNEKFHEEIYKNISYNLQDILKLKLNEKKEEQGNLRKKCFDYLGYTIGLTNLGVPNITVKKQNILKMEKRIIDLITRYKYQNNDGSHFSTKAFIFELNIMISGTVSSNIDGSAEVKRRYGWVFFYAQINDLSALYHLDNFIKKKLLNILPDNERKQIKRFSKAYHEIKYNFNNTKYIFRLDLMSSETKKQLLNDLYNISKDTDEEIEKTFRKVVYRKIQQNELDIIHNLS